MYEASCIIGAACMIGILLVFILLIKLTGLENWRIILNQTLSTYVEIKQVHPDLSDKEVFMNVLDDRYKMKKYYAKKEKLKDMIEQEIEEGRSILNTYNLPILIYISLIIEKNKILKTYSPAHNMLAVIKVELRRQGFLKYV
ncbi:hypothetical protein [Aminipila terrae]|uniref:Uncharacterized protein n=1 Tax=Aminipila terrae TaxID=2697030 RepID=A0A6P1MG61_9FIRM|nr:hypothetical protein [Aminipila terrae]QHI71574.1 hypothetical protein Ami3637_03515 [Aminipila terrae]